MGITENAVMGHCIRAMQRADMKPEQIRAVMEELKFLLDRTDPADAIKMYEQSAY